MSDNFATISGNQGNDAIATYAQCMQYDPKPPFDAGEPPTAATTERVFLIEKVLRKYDSSKVFQLQHNPGVIDVGSRNNWCQ